MGFLIKKTRHRQIVTIMLRKEQLLYLELLYRKLIIAELYV